MIANQQERLTSYIRYMLSTRYQKNVDDCLDKQAVWIVLTGNLRGALKNESLGKSWKVSVTINLRGLP